MLSGEQWVWETLPQVPGRHCQEAKSLSSPLSTPGDGASSPTTHRDSPPHAAQRPSMTWESVSAQETLNRRGAKQGNPRWRYGWEL